jgi:hypothetical protein
VILHRLERQPVAALAEEVALDRRGFDSVHGPVARSSAMLGRGRRGRRPRTGVRCRRSASPHQATWPIGWDALPGQIGTLGGFCGAGGRPWQVRRTSRCGVPQNDESPARMRGFRPSTAVLSPSSPAEPWRPRRAAGASLEGEWYAAALKVRRADRGWAHRARGPPCTESSTYRLTAERRWERTWHRGA